MVTDQPPIPEPIWRRIREFLMAGKGGQIVLNVAPGGRVVSCELREHVKSEEASG